MSTRVRCSNFNPVFAFLRFFCSIYDKTKKLIKEIGIILFNCFGSKKYKKFSCAIRNFDTIIRGKYSEENFDTIIKEYYRHFYVSMRKISLTSREESCENVFFPDLWVTIFSKIYFSLK